MTYPIPRTIKEEPEAPPGLIMGQRAGSVYEWRVSLALDKFGWKYYYQVSLFGGRAMRGGQVMDFLVQTLPLPTPLYVYGEYWHGGKQEERDKLMQHLLTGMMHGSINEPVIIAGDECHNQAAADNAVLKYFGRAS